jgi:hypothetical protein
MKYDREYDELQEKYDNLQKEFDQYKLESIKWDIIDFLDYDTNGEYTITEEQAQKALEHLIRSHDAQYGIGWHNIAFYIGEYGTKNPDYEQSIQ